MRFEHILCFSKIEGSIIPSVKFFLTVKLFSLRIRKKKYGLTWDDVIQLYSITSWLALIQMEIIQKVILWIFSRLSREIMSIKSTSFGFKIMRWFLIKICQKKCFLKRLPGKAETKNENATKTISGKSWSSHTEKCEKGLLSKTLKNY